VAGVERKQVIDNWDRITAILDLMADAIDARVGEVPRR
jgi:hypothetical protein